MAHLTPQQALDLAMDHHRAGRLAPAEEIYRKLHALEPGNADVIHLLGLIAFHSGRRAEAREMIERAISLQPNAPHFYNNYGTLLTELREYEAARAAYATGLRLDPKNASCWYNLGLVHTHQRQWAAAIDAYREALRWSPGYPECALNLGTALAASGQVEAGIALYRAELQRRPQDASIATNLGNLYKEIGDTDAAIETYRLALAADPNDSVTLNNLAVALREQGQFHASIAAFRRCVALKPDHAEMRSNLILSLFYDPGTELATIEEEQRLWNRHLLDPLKATHAAHANDRSPERRLRIGYVSPDLRDHVVGRALLPVFERHDREQFELFCYTIIQRDAVTERFRRRSDGWCETTNLSDEQLARRIQDDRIDILVDLALHTSDNRLRVFARKAAPVQVSWLGYPGSTGVETIDYRLTDPFLEPAAADSRSSGEQPWRLPDCWTCYEPPEGYPPVNDLPALAHGHVTFGSFNSFVKINDRVLDVWARILAAVPASRIVLLTKSGAHRQRLGEFLQARGLDPARLEFADYESASAGNPSATYLRRYGKIDLALDTFPYNGMTTTLDALWMGVPVVSLVGKFSLGRAGLSLLSNVGLQEFAVESEDEYAQRAVALAGDLPRLATLRASLRSRLQSSPLLDADRLTRHVEAAYRTMWRRWC